MANLNALIAQGYQFQPPVNPFVQYGQMQQLEQGQQTNELNRMKMQEFQRGMEETNALRRLDPESPTYLQDVTRISPEKGFAFAKSQQEAKTARTEGQTKEVKLLTDKLSLLPQAYQMADTPEAYLALHQSVHADPVLGPWLKSTGATPEKGLATLQNAIQTGKFDDLRLKSMQSVSQLLDSMKPISVAASSSVYDPRQGTFKQAPAAPDKDKVTDLMANYKAAQAQGFIGSIFDYEKKIKEAGRTPPTPAQPSAPVAVVDLVTGKQVYVSREDALRGRMTPAAAMESLPPKEIQKREAALPQATSAVKGIEAKATGFIKDLEELRDHPGLSSITGIAAGRLPGITAEGRAAQAIYDKIVAKGGFQALQEMRDASKTGGALGNVSNQEGTQLKASFAAIDRRQDANDVKKAIKDAIIDIERTTTRMREAYESTYSYKSGGGAAAPASSTGIDASNPLLK